MKLLPLEGSLLNFSKVRVTTLTQGGLRAMSDLEELERARGRVNVSNAETCLFKIGNTKYPFSSHPFSKRFPFIQSLDGLSEDNLQFLFDMIQRFMKPTEIAENNNEIF